MNNREAMQKAFEGQKFKVFSPFKCDISKNENGDYVEDETIFAFAWFCRGIASQAQLETELAEARKDQARYKFVRGMEPEDFENLPTYSDDFDCQVDELMKRCKQ